MSTNDDIIKEYTTGAKDMTIEEYAAMREEEETLKAELNTFEINHYDLDVERKRIERQYLVTCPNAELKWIQEICEKILWLREKEKEKK